MSRAWLFFGVLAASAAVSGPAGAVPDGPSTPGSEAPISPEAREHFNAGVALLQDPEGERVEEAYREFKVAYDLSGSAKILGNMGFCAMKLERDGEAIEAYSRYLREVTDIDPEEREQIVRDLQTLTVGLVRVTIRVSRPGVRVRDVRIPVRGDRVTNAFGPIKDRVEIGLRPGHHIITATAPGYQDAIWEFDAFAGARENYSFDLQPQYLPMQGTQLTGQPDGAKRLLPWLTLGVGVAALGAGAITGVVALDKTQDIEHRCPDDLCPIGYDLNTARASARGLVRITDILIFGGGAITAAGAFWLFSTSRDKGSPAGGETVARRKHLPFSPAADLRASALCVASGCYGSVRVAF